MQYYDVITNLRWRTAANMKFVVLVYLKENWSEYESGIMIRQKFKLLNLRLRTDAI